MVLVVASGKARGGAYIGWENMLVFVSLVRPPPIGRPANNRDSD